MNLQKKAGDAVRGLARDPFEIFRLAGIVWCTLKFRYLRRCAGPGSVFGTRNRIINAANVRIGRGCLFQDSIYIRAGISGRVRIGDRAAINSFCQLYGHGGITLGDETQLGPNTVITTTHHDYGGNLEERFRPVTIGRRVWIGANVTVLSGVSIGDGAVIGAGAVVTRDIPARTLAVGVPARVIRRLDGASDSTGSAPHAVHASIDQRPSASIAAKA